jgi:hypothetical protein
MTTSLRPLAVLVLMLVALGCGGGKQAPPNQTVAASSAPPPPPAPADSSQIARATSPAAGDIPAWAGQSQNEPFDVRQFLASRAAPADNAAPLYRSALRPLSGELAGAPAEQLETQLRDLANVEKLAAGDVSLAHVEQALSATKAVAQQTDAAQAKPQCIFITGLTADAVLPHAQASRSLTRLCVLQLYYAREKSDFNEAETALRRGLRMSRDLQPRGVSVCQLVSLANQGVLYSACERLTLNDPRLTAAQCDRLLGLLVEHGQMVASGYEEGVRMDYILARNSIHDLQTGRLTLGQIHELLSGEENTLGAVQLNQEAEITACSRLYALALAAAKNQTARADEFAAFQAELAKLRSDWESFKSKAAATPPATRQGLLAQMPAMQFYTWTAGIEAGRAADWRLRANLAGLQMLVALKRYELTHQRMPATLAEAAAESVLKSVPIDPYSGQPLKFAMIDGRATIYSVGKDFKDDGGRVDWKLGTAPGDYLFVLAPHSTRH